MESLTVPCFFLPDSRRLNETEGSPYLRHQKDLPPKGQQVFFAQSTRSIEKNTLGASSLSLDECLQAKLTNSGYCLHLAMSRLGGLPKKRL